MICFDRAGLLFRALDHDGDQYIGSSDVRRAGRALRKFLPGPEEKLQEGDRLLFAGRGVARHEMLFASVPVVERNSWQYTCSCSVCVSRRYGWPQLAAGFDIKFGVAKGSQVLRGVMHRAL